VSDGDNESTTNGGLKGEFNGITTSEHNYGTNSGFVNINSKVGIGSTRNAT
jgi:hypothetical protein